MKAVLDKKNFKITFDNDAVKAIRFVNGYNKDLRISLGRSKSELNHLYNFIEAHGPSVFGFDFFDVKRDAVDEDWDRYEKMLWDAARQIAR